MNQTVIIAVAVIVAIALLLLLVLRSRKQRVTFSDSTALPRATKPAEPAPVSHVAPDAIPPRTEPAPVAAPVAPATEGDTLTTLKGLGPKAASRLAELGVTRFEQIASWNAQDIEAIDIQMGAFKGRILRDRWVEQAQLLAAGDIAGFEEKFGKLGA